MRVYKVVERQGRELRSAVAYGMAKVIYKREWVEAPEWLAEQGYHLTAFKSLEDAVRFRNVYSLNDAEVWEAEADGVTDNLPCIASVNLLSIGRIVSNSVYPGWPKGTVMCKRLKLVRRVE